MADAYEKMFSPAVLAAAMFAYAPVVIAHAPYESTMGLVQKIFYFHVPVVDGDVRGDRRLRRRERDLPVQGAARRRIASRSRRPRSTVLFGVMGLVTGPLWGRKAWGVWWQWDARLTMALLLELIFICVSARAASTAGPAPTSWRRRSASSAWRCAVRLRVGQHLAHDSSADLRSCRRCQRRCAVRSGSASPAFMLLLALLLMLRVQPRQKRQAALDELVSGGRGLMMNRLFAVVVMCCCPRRFSHSVLLSPRRRFAAGQPPPGQSEFVPIDSAAAGRAAAGRAAAGRGLRVRLARGDVLRLVDLAAAEQGRGRDARLRKAPRAGRKGPRERTGRPR